MTANLIVIHKGDIVFSPYITKPNGYPILISLQSMIIDRDKRFFFNIPIRSEGMFGIRQYDKLEGMYYNYYTVRGGQFISLGVDVVNEFYFPLNEDTKIKSGELYGYIIPTDEISASFVRSNIQEMESAATAAAMIYDNAIDIYKSAFKAVFNTYPSFYTGKLQNLRQSLKGFEMLFNLSANKRDKAILTLTKTSDVKLADILSLKFYR